MGKMYFTPTVFMVDMQVEDLPAWARKSPAKKEILWMARNNLAYRSQLHRGDFSPQWRKLLTKLAERIYSARKDAG